MTTQEFESLIKKDKYQVFIFTSPCSIPISFAGHPWFVVNNKGTLSRWEILFRKNLNATSWGHLHKDLTLPSNGMEVSTYIKKLRWGSTLLKIIEGDENSTAREMADFISRSKENYPYCYKYSFFGPNSNTYAKWVLNNFSDLNIELPWNCFGKNFKI